MKGKFNILWILLGLVIVAVLAYISIGNQLVGMEEKVNTAWAEVENQFQRRYDLIPNLVATVKGFAAQEQAVIDSVTEARAKLGGASTIDDKIDAANGLEGALSRLLVVIENYPELKSNVQFSALMDELSGTENRISVARGRYNDEVRLWNTKIRTFPTSIIAGMRGFTAKKLFESVEGSDTAPKVEF